MSFVRNGWISVAWTMLALQGNRLHGQTSPPTTASHLLLRTPAAGQAADNLLLYRDPETTTEGVLREMASRAAVIFVGTVTAVHKPSDDDLQGAIANSAVEVNFAVGRSVVGPAAGSTYVMREWAGLWRDSPRFLVGQRLLMLLHSAGPGGLSSPVDGLDGAIPVKSPVAATASGSQLGAFGTADASTGDVVDMRWLLAKTLHTTTIADDPIASPGESLVGPFISSPALGASAAKDPIEAVRAATATKLSDVLGLLMSWQQTGNVSH